MAERLVPLERIEQTILILRGHRVLLDADLAELYGVEVKVLNQAVRRNAERFPRDFMFRLTREEMGRSRSQSVTLNVEATDITGDHGDPRRRMHRDENIKLEHHGPKADFHRRVPRRR
jgi:hypothetical protein